jgi:hypothetical protein
MNDAGSRAAGFRTLQRNPRPSAAWWRSGSRQETAMENSKDPLAQFGLDAIDLRWTLKDIAAKRSWIINEAHVSKLIELGLVEMRDGKPFLTIAGQDTAWDG